LFDWLREQYIIMAKNNNTPVSFWLELPLTEFSKWIRASNSVIEKSNQK
jgi:hypothetical protein